MNKVKGLYLLAILLLSSKFSDLYSQINPSTSFTIFEIGNNRIEVLNLKYKEFNIHISGDTAVFESLVFDSFNGKTLAFSEGLQNVQVKVKYGFSLLQYTTDDVRASPISYFKFSDWFDLDVNNNHIKVPNYYGNTDTLRVHQLMGFENMKGIENWIREHDFESIRNISFESQKSFFKKLIDDKEAYEECCQQYIIQAQKFLSSSIEDYKSFADLNLELYPEQIIIVISGTSEPGTLFRKTIIEKQNSFR
ncbi:MAG: hypothetical protein HWE07_08485 [Cytophagia bacterium]|nr:hypothetical protein [Cytophagia bacterium]